MFTQLHAWIPFSFEWYNSPTHCWSASQVKRKLFNNLFMCMWVYVSLRIAAPSITCFIDSIRKSFFISQEYSLRVMFEHNMVGQSTSFVALDQAEKTFKNSFMKTHPTSLFRLICFYWLYVWLMSICAPWFLYPDPCATFFYSFLPPEKIGNFAHAH